VINSKEHRPKTLRSLPLGNASRSVKLPSRYAIIARRAVSVRVGSAIGFVSTVVAFEFSVESPAGNSQHFRCSGFISIRECDGSADEFAFNLIKRENSGKQ
jgi:hypothetical protein